MFPVVFTKTLAAASATNIAASQSPGAARVVTLNGTAVAGGVAVLDSQRRIIITSGGNDTGVTFVVTGTNDAGVTVVDRFLGANGAAAQSNLDFRTVSSITYSPATAGTITVGTNTTGSSQWFMPSFHMAPFTLDIESAVTGTVTYSVEITMDDYYTAPGQPSVPWAGGGPIVIRPTTVVASTTSSSLVLTSPCRGWRLTITAGAGSVACEALQAGIANY